MFVGAIFLLSLGAQSALEPASEPTSKPASQEASKAIVAPDEQSPATEGEDAQNESVDDLLGEGTIIGSPEDDSNLSFLTASLVVESVFRRSADAAFKQSLAPAIKAGWNNEFLPGWLTYIGGGLGLYQEGGGTDRIRVNQVALEATGQANMGPFWGARHATLSTYGLVGARGSGSFITRQFDDDARQTFSAAGGLFVGAGASMRLYFINTRIEYSLGFLGPAFDSRASFSMGVAF